MDPVKIPSAGTSTLTDVPLNVTLNCRLTRGCAMAAKLIDLTAYRKSKQEKKRLKRESVPGSRSVGKGTHIIGGVRYTPMAKPRGPRDPNGGMVA